MRIAAACAAAGDPASLRGGPCFTFPERLGADFPSPLPLLLSDAEGRSAARELARPDNWRPGEWAEPVSGAAGEWAMAVRDGSPVSICHTPAAAWSRRARHGKGVLFYSTTADNHASRSVARTLDLAPLGRIWTVR
ncbi:hypothetical protein [Streptomyces atriruber]|uniref:hypothetical protein n=1 Tax=Streptomyces atriruber TaxID=545121 RepID=UPI0006E1F5CA|nr:hypothetical protein [Streptomyces atriruber]